MCRWSRLLVSPPSPSRLATHPTNPIRSVRLGPDVTVIYKYIHIQGTQTPDVVKWCRARTRDIIMTSFFFFFFKEKKKHALKLFFTGACLFFFLFSFFLQCWPAHPVDLHIVFRANSLKRTKCVGLFAKTHLYSGQECVSVIRNIVHLFFLHRTASLRKKILPEAWKLLHICYWKGGWDLSDNSVDVKDKTNDILLIFFGI